MSDASKANDTREWQQDAALAFWGRESEGVGTLARLFLLARLGLAGSFETNLWNGVNF
jgi:hypothetical protein